MKKFWIVLLSLGLIMAFSLPVFAADVKFNGEFKVQGIYEDNQFAQGSPNNNKGVSLIWQRLRIGTVFQVAEGLKLTTRFDALEKVWGAPRTGYPLTATATYPVGSSVATSGTGGFTTTDSENIKFEQAFVTFNIPYGVFDVGYQTQSRFGTAAFDNGDRDIGPRIKYTFVTGPLTILAIFDEFEGNKNIFTPGTNNMDQDFEKVALAGIYKWGTGEAGLLGQYIYLATLSSSAAAPLANLRQKLYLLDPYFKATFGPVYVEAEFAYLWGKQREFSPSAAGTDIDRNGFSAYIMAKVDLAPFYVGAAYVYVTGDKKDDNGKDGSGPGTGTDFTPCLMMLNYDLYRFGGFIGGAGSPLAPTYTGVPYRGYNTSDGSGMTNVSIYHVFAGMKPIPKLDVKASYTYANFNETAGTLAGGPKNGNPGAGVDKSIGSEFDLTASYKIYDNLSYMVGFGYFIPGDFFKGGVAATQLGNDYMLTHMLTLTF